MLMEDMQVQATGQGEELEQQLQAFEEELAITSIQQPETASPSAVRTASGRAGAVRQAPSLLTHIGSSANSPSAYARERDALLEQLLQEPVSRNPSQAPSFLS